MSQPCADGSLPVLTSNASPSAAHTPGEWLAAHRPQTTNCVINGFYAVWPDNAPAVAYVFGREEALLIAAARELLTEAREICAILDCYRADTGEEPCFDHEAIGEEVARRHDSLTAAICKALGQ